MYPEKREALRGKFELNKTEQNPEGTIMQVNNL